MRNSLCACFAVVAVLCSAVFADAAQPSAAKMSQMGLSGATVVSDSDAMSVRGMGFYGGSRNKVTIWGESKVKVEAYLGPVQVTVKSEHGYYSETSGSQIGGDLSFVGVAVIGGNNNNVGLTQTGGGGGIPIIFSGGVSGVFVGGR